MQRELYDTARETRTGDEFVSVVTNDYFSALCPTIVLDDFDEAVRIGARGQRFFGEAINHWARGAPPPAENTEDEDSIAVIAEQMKIVEDRLARGELDEDQFSLASASFNIDHAYGTFETAIEYVHKLKDAGTDEVMCIMQMGTIPHEVCLETIRQWGERVIPYFRSAELDEVPASTGDSPLREKKQ
jgi:hypothetical protein